MSRQYEDELAVKRAIDGYSDALNHREWHKVREAFTPQAIWRTMNFREFSFETAGGITEGLRAVVEAMEILVQFPIATVVNIDDDRATARSSIQEIGKFEGGSFFCLGSYSDALVREGAVWRFVSREFSYLYWEENGLTGTAFPLAPRA